MGLPGDVATHIEVQASPAAYPHALRSHHTPTTHRGVNATFTAGPRVGLGELGWLPLARGIFLHLHYLAPSFKEHLWQA